MSSLGTLVAEIALDSPRKVHWGRSDTINGHVAVTFKPSAGNNSAVSELFGPFILKITFRGHTAQTFTSGNFKYKEQRGLFKLLVTIHDGSFKFTPGAKNCFPFHLEFPSCTSLVAHDSSVQSGYQFKSEEGQMLPPSVDVWGRDLKVIAEYRIGVNGGMSGINVDFQGTPSISGPLLNYDGPRPAPSDSQRRLHSWQEQIKIPASQLLPAAERPSFLKRRTNSLLSKDPCPTFSFDVGIAVPIDLHIGKPLELVVTVRPSPDTTCNESSCIDISLVLPTITVWAHTRAHFERPFIGSKKLSYKMDSLDLAKTLSPSVTGLEKSFAETHCTKTVKTEALNIHPASFDTGALCRTYTLKIEVKFLVSGKKMSFKKSFGVKIHPPVLNLPQSNRVATNTLPSMLLSDFPRPSNAVLPPYEPPPPEYHAREVPNDRATA